MPYKIFILDKVLKVHLASACLVPLADDVLDSLVIRDANQVEDSLQLRHAQHPISIPVHAVKHFL